MYSIVYDKKAIKDIAKLKSAKLDSKAKSLIDILRENPYQYPPPFEKLQGDLSGAYSRRINIQHRLVYEVLKKKQTVKIISMWWYSQASGCPNGF
jgi:toxin YoeB